jgi:cadmium resistance protein CadD (predicted permease)
MNNFVADAVIASVAFVGTMFDNYFAYAAQLLVTEAKKINRVRNSQILGIISLILVAAVLGDFLQTIPTRAIGVLAFVPWYFAFHAWQSRNKEPRKIYKRGALTTFLMTFAIGGDNIAVWTPLLRASDNIKTMISVGAFIFWELIFVATAQMLTQCPRVVAWGNKRAPELIPWIYLLLGVMILVECRTL